MNRTTLVSPSILAADFANIETEVKMVNDSAADYIHIDIMDGHFVPNISFGFPVTKAIQKHSKKTLDFHLMISNPDNYLEACIDSGAAIITVHVEVCHDLRATINRIKKFGAKAGVAVNPGTDIESLKEIISDIDLVLLMSVNQGFGGQSFIDNTYNKTTTRGGDSILSKILKMFRIKKHDIITKLNYILGKDQKAITNILNQYKETWTFKI